MSPISHQRLLEVLDYNPSTGDFHWKVAISRRVRVGELAGTVMKGKHGRVYRRVKIDGQLYNMHSLAWFYVNQAWPNHIIDHKTGSSNAIFNLRPATYRQNAGNKRTVAKHGFKGVAASRNQFRARINDHGSPKTIGYFATAREAALAYDQAAIAVFGQFALTNKQLGLL